MTTLSVGVGQVVRGMGLALSLALLGCASSSGAARPLTTDVRGNASLLGQQARPMVVGPMRLLHANFDRKAKVKFTRTWQRDGGADCRNGAPLSWDGESEIQIQKDELVCVSGTARSAVAWHGRSVTADALPMTGHASLP
jgi:hypothetical protein